VTERLGRLIDARRASIAGEVADRSRRGLGMKETLIKRLG